MGVPDDDIEELLDSPAGAGMLDTGRALPYDYAVLGDGLVPTALVAKVTAPTLILAAEAMPETAQALAEAIPGARFDALKGPTYETPPAELAERVAEFLDTRA
jgi:hypothetical protein